MAYYLHESPTVSPTDHSRRNSAPSVLDREAPTDDARFQRS